MHFTRDFTTAVGKHVCVLSRIGFTGFLREHVAVRAELSATCLLKCVVLVTGVPSCPVMCVTSVVHACMRWGNRWRSTRLSLPGSPGGRLAVDHIVERALEEADIYREHRVVGNHVWSASTSDIMLLHSVQPPHTSPPNVMHATTATCFLCGSIPRTMKWLS